MMDFITFLIDFILHLDKHLSQLISDYESWTYAILFLIIFVETGLVIMPFLPGDSLLFAAGAFAAIGAFEPVTLMVLLIIAAVLGDTLNYHIGKFIGHKVFSLDFKYLNKSHLAKTQAFYDKHGGKTIIFARFIPIIRTFAPFVAGMGTMDYKKFILFNVVGGVSWVVGFVGLGYFVGNDPFIKKNFTLVILAIILISITPPIFEYLRNRSKSKIS